MIRGIVFLTLFLCVTLNSEDISYIDWKAAKIYSSVTVNVVNDSKFAHNRLLQGEEAKKRSKSNFYKLLKDVNLSYSETIFDHMKVSGDKNRKLFFLINKAVLDKIEYPDEDSITFLYSMNLYGKDNSLMSIILGDSNLYVEDLISYMDYNYQTSYTGVIIDARGGLKSFDGYDVDVIPSVFLTVKDSTGKKVFDRYNVSPDVIMTKGMALYVKSLAVDLSERVGEAPLKIVAYGTGDRRGAVIVISTSDAKKLLSSSVTREAIKNGKIAVIVD